MHHALEIVGTGSDIMYNIYIILSIQHQHHVAGNLLLLMNEQSFILKNIC